jgi:hypothetical protein
MAVDGTEQKRQTQPLPSRELMEVNEYICRREERQWQAIPAIRFQIFDLNSFIR